MRPVWVAGSVKSLGSVWGSAACKVINCSSLNSDSDCRVRKISIFLWQLSLLYSILQPANSRSVFHICLSQNQEGPWRDAKYADLELEQKPAPDTLTSSVQESGVQSLQMPSSFWSCSGSVAAEDDSSHFPCLQGHYYGHSLCWSFLCIN